MISVEQAPLSGCSLRLNAVKEYKNMIWAENFKLDKVLETL